jgi:hypothetical protein
MNGSCVEIRQCADGTPVDLGDSKDLDGEVLHYTHDEWTAFIGAVKAGEFDDLV